MAIVGRRKNESILGRLWRALSATSAQNGLTIASAEHFQFELSREISRSNRRKVGREFALIYLTFHGGSSGLLLNEELLQDYHRRLRISDTIGQHRSKLAFLLPETDRDGGLLVARDLERISARHGIQATSSLSVYPCDESLFSQSDELDDDDFPPTDWSDDSDGGNGDHFHHNGNASGGLNGSHHFANGHHHDDHGQNGYGANGHVSSVVYEISPAGVRMDNGVPFSSESISLNGNSSVAVLDLVDGNKTNRFANRSWARAGLGRRSVNLPRYGVKVSRLNGDSQSIAQLPTPWWKRTVDVVGAGTGLLILSPVFLAAAVAIKLGSPGPVFFRQLREGKDGKQFAILKFRTMVPDAENLQDSLRTRSEQDGPAFKLEDDPRVTRVGRYLRRSCVDELPQLVNVLLGQMSLVGPRPLPVVESHACRCWQRMRLTVLPGLTCTWQIQGGRRVKFEQWMRMDLEYIRNRSFLYDLKLILRTAMLAALHRGSV